MNFGLESFGDQSSGKSRLLRRITMAIVLRGGESLDVDDVRYDETGRFQLILQTDGNLVLYAH